MKRFAKEARKTLVALVGVVAEAVSLGLLTGSAAKYAGIAVAIATAIGVHQVPNQPAAA